MIHSIISVLLTAVFITPVLTGAAGTRKKPLDTEYYPY